MLAEMGVQRIELPFGNEAYFNEFSLSSIAELRRVLNETGVSVQSVHLSFSAGMDIGEPDPLLRRTVVVLLKQQIMLAAELGARVAVQHPSLYWGEEGRQERIDAAADSVAELAQTGRQLGVVLAVENMLGTLIGRHEDELNAVVSRADPQWCGFCFDTGHANLHGRLVPLAEALLPRSITTHIHDNDGQDDLHMFPGTKDIDWAALGSAFRKTNCPAFLTVESNKLAYPTWSESEQALRDPMTGGDATWQKCCLNRMCVSN